MLCLFGPVEKGFQGQPRAGWSRWDTRMNMMENHKLQVFWACVLVFWAMGTVVGEKSHLEGFFLSETWCSSKLS